MIRYTTPTVTLTLPNEVDLTTADNVYVTFAKQDGVITKTGEDLTVSAHQVEVALTQRETATFKGARVAIQVNWTYSGGQRACSNIAFAEVGENLLDKVVE